MSSCFKSFLHVLLLSLITCFVFISCGTAAHVQPIHDNVNVRDSIAIHWVDSTRYIPIEVVKEIANYPDTLKMETSLAEAEAYIDTTHHVLRGSIKNKKEIEFKYKYITKTEYKDSIQIKEIPVEVEKIVEKTKHPFYESILWLFTIIGLGAIAIKIIKLYVKHKTP